MSDPLWIWGDPILGTLNVLRGAGTPPGVAGTVQFGIREPRPKSFEPKLPYVMVSSDGEQGRTNADQTASVRVVVWAPTEAQARAIAAWARAVLLASTGDGENVRHFGRQFGLLPAHDPDTGGTPICSFTVAARLLPVALST